MGNVSQPFYFSSWKRMVNFFFFLKHKCVVESLLWNLYYFFFNSEMVNIIGEAKRENEFVAIV